MNDLKESTLRMITDNDQYLLDVITLHYLGITDVANELEVSIAVVRLRTKFGDVTTSNMLYQLNRSV